jgi:hypothetical protein
MFLKQSTTVTIYLGPYVDDTDGKTAETALTITAYLSKAGAAAGARNSATGITHDRDGYYRVELNATDTNTLGPLRVFSNTSGALPVWRDFAVLPANVYDSLIAGSDALQVHANEITANLITAASLNADAAAEIADAIWDEARTGHTTAGTFGLYLDAQVSAAASPPTAAAIADAVWDEGLGAHLSAGSAGDALNDAGGSAADPWASALPGAYTSGQAGWILGERLDAKVSAMSGSSPGAGANEFEYTLTETGSGDPIPDADVWATTDSTGSVVVASGRTNQYGVVTFYLDSGTVYIWRQKSGYNFTNPDTEIVV